MRRNELWLLPLAAFGIIVAALLSDRGTSGDALRDRRRSILLAGPGGSKGLADVLEQLGVSVVARRTTLFDWGRNSDGASDGSELLALLDVPSALTDVELRVVRDYVATGGALLLAGRNGVERCFGYRVRLFGSFQPDSARTLQISSDTSVVARAVLERMPPDSTIALDALEQVGCPVLLPTETDTLLATDGGTPVVMRLGFAGGGDVTILADSRLVSNRWMKETGVGRLVVSWILEARPSRVVVDEYHQGFGEHPSILGAAWRWILATPGGWTILQLSAAGLVALAFLAVRFGPAIKVIERRRRSPIEHVEALAAGLERADGRTTAINLIVSGLWRRLGRSGSVGRQRKGNASGWLENLDLAVHTTDAREKIKHLKELIDEPGGKVGVLNVATSVEDVWEAMRLESKHSGS